MFSVLYLNVMCPLNEVHRFIDEAHESSLRVGDLIGCCESPLTGRSSLLSHASPTWAWESLSWSPRISRWSIRAIRGKGDRRSTAFRW